MTMNKAHITGIFLALALAAATLTGCKGFDGDKVRREHAESYPQALAEMTEQSLAERWPLGLGGLRANCAGPTASRCATPRSSSGLRRWIARLPLPTSCRR